MAYAVFIEAKIETDEGGEVATLNRTYDLAGLQNIQGIFQHAGECASLLVEGAEHHGMQTPQDTVEVAARSPKTSAPARPLSRESERAGR